MKFSRNEFFSPPKAAVAFVIIANLVEYVLCALASGSATPSSEILLRNGAMTSSALPEHQYWRLFAYGFLHSSPTHLAMNMLSLIILGTQLERRIGATYFLLVYICALAAGASGALFGLLGALFALWIIGKSQLSPLFFLVNFALNFAFAIREPRIDWGAHIGGFVAGMAAIALLDAAERCNSLWLRCKFPEFAKLNAWMLAAALGFWVLNFPVEIFSGDVRLIVLVWLIASLAFVKGIDLLLTRRRGLAVSVVIFVLTDALAAFFFGRTMETLYLRFCASEGLSGRNPFATICGYPGLGSTALALVVAALAAMLLSPQFARGCRDSGFIAAGYVAERQRRHGI